MSIILSQKPTDITLLRRYYWTLFQPLTNLFSGSSGTNRSSHHHWCILNIKTFLKQNCKRRNSSIYTKIMILHKIVKWGPELLPQKIRHSMKLHQTHSNIIIYISKYISNIIFNIYLSYFSQALKNLMIFFLRRGCLLDWKLTKNTPSQVVIQELKTYF